MATRKISSCGDSIAPYGLHQYVQGRKSNINCSDSRDIGGTCVYPIIKITTYNRSCQILDAGCTLCAGFTCTVRVYCT